jgi:uncharacterized membrane protein
MKKMNQQEMNLLFENSDQLQRINDIVFKSVEEEKLISEKLYEFEDKNLPFRSWLADKIASFGGSWIFVILFVGTLITWMLVNLYLLNKPFDPYPFILLNLVLSTVAAMQAPIIMMSQNRKEEKDRQRSINDYMVNLKAEIEVRTIQQKLDLLITEQMNALFQIQKLQMEMIEEIKAKLGSTIKDGAD